MGKPAVSKRVPAELPWEKRPGVVHLTAQILRLQGATAATVVESVIAIGDAAREIKDELSRQEWARWCDDAVPFARQTVSNYMALSRWAEERPKEVDKLAHLGPSKLYLLLPLPTAVRRRIVRKTPVDIPGGGRKTVELMTVAELARVTAEASSALPEHTPMPVGRVVGRLRRSIAGLDASARTLIERADELDAEDARALYDSVLEVADVLRTQFDL